MFMQLHILAPFCTTNARDLNDVRLTHLLLFVMKAIRHYSSVFSIDIYIS